MRVWYARDLQDRRRRATQTTDYYFYTYPLF